MKSNFINITLGTNKWWQYGLSILSTVAAIALVNILIRQVFQSIKALFPDNDFGKSLFTFSLLLLVFGTAFIVFLFTASKLDQRAKMSFIANQSRFSVSKRPSPCLKASQSARPLSEIIKFYDKGKINEGFV
jgi:cytochrome c biogenesis protein CcdA